MSQAPVSLDFFQIKEILSNQIQSTPFQFQQEKEDLVFRLESMHSDPRILVPFLGCVKNFIENFRIVTWEENYFSLQALPDNLFEKLELLDRIRIRLLFSSQGSKLEITKRVGFTDKEVQACIALAILFSENNTEKRNPETILRKLGAELFFPDNSEPNFDSFFGYMEVKKQVKESLIFPLLHPEPFLQISKFTRGKEESLLPRAVLFEGSPGVGKTSMAKIAAQMGKIPLVYVPIETILSKYYGESSQNLAAVFDATALFPKAFLFLDEIDSLATSREDGLFEATRNLLSVLLRKLDGVTKTGRIITIGATNRREDLDPALLSRFDRKIFFPLPDLYERSEILSGYAQQLDVSTRLYLSERLVGFSGRNLKDFCDAVERKWIAKIIESGEPLGPPPPSLYQETLEEISPRDQKKGILPKS